MHIPPGELLATCQTGNYYYDKTIESAILVSASLIN